MSTNWESLILGGTSPQETWKEIFTALHNDIKDLSSPVALHDLTVAPDRLLSEAAWELWEAYPRSAPLTAKTLTDWWNLVTGNKAVLILDALSLRELAAILGGAQFRDIKPTMVQITGSECPSTTDMFAKALGANSRGAIANDCKPKSFALQSTSTTNTNVERLPFEDCPVPTSANVVIWHTWLDDLIHLQKKLPDQIAVMASAAFQSDGFWSYVNKLRQGRSLIITSDHGYAVSKRFSSEVQDPEAVDILRSVFSASRYTQASGAWDKRFMPPIVMSNNEHHVVTGQRKWKVQGGFPHVCHGGMSLLEVAVPFIEISPL